MRLASREPWTGVPEEMDRPDADGPDLRRALVELDVIHRWLGGRRASARALRRLQPRLGRRPTLLDVGAGGAALRRCLPAGATDWRLVLTDFNAAICRNVKEQSQLAVVQSDAEMTSFRESSVDVVHCGLFLHHFPLPRAAAILRDLARVARVAVVVNDLHRHAVPWLAVAAGARCLSRSRMVRHDAALSVARGFRRSDWQQLADGAGFRWTRLERVWPYRWLAVLELPARERR